MDKKQGVENTEFIKEADNDKSNFIFQKNTKTKVGTSILIGLLILIIAALLISLFYFQTSA